MITAKSYIDWTGCELVERVPGKVSGQPIIRGTRSQADTIFQSFGLGENVEEIRQSYPGLTVAQINRLIQFAKNSLRK